MGAWRVSRTRRYDHVAQIIRLTSYKRGNDGNIDYINAARTALRYSFPQQLAALLSYNGFTIIRQYGDWKGEALSAASPSIISVCRKRRSQRTPCSSVSGRDGMLPHRSRLEGEYVGVKIDELSGR